MGLFKSLFGTSSDSNNKEDLPWIPLTSESQLETLVENSNTKPQLIFKHSTRCGISRMTLNQFQAQFPESGLHADLYYLDLLSFRSISNLVAKRFQVFHQSPQVLIIKNGIAVVNESHGAINSLNLAQYN
ncbi:bacillithiol system redox-active protein YtxJ [Winogradskyella aurantiaca]|uniref:bacillithiol system redox-active protein YtxJ n=1 Tax=Winogradskyella aurantiaca TaxID=2219558 RepID=UPI000E1D0DAB|nr:bacillithiol system redox-active protein YtxJ [Winogradskyella aurantiaca]